jgi:hypothetical protein
MELLIALVALVLIDLLAIQFGADSHTRTSDHEINAAVRSGS